MMERTKTEDFFALADCAILAARPFRAVKGQAPSAWPCGPPLDSPRPGGLTNGARKGEKLQGGDARWRQGVSGVKRGFQKMQWFLYTRVSRSAGTAIKMQKMKPWCAGASSLEGRKKKMAKTILICGRCGAQEEYRAAKEGGWVVARKRPGHGLILRCQKCAKKTPSRSRGKREPRAYKSIHYKFIPVEQRGEYIPPIPRGWVLDEMFYHDNAYIYIIRPLPGIDVSLAPLPDDWKELDLSDGKVYVFRREYEQG